jgi:hypothetical protein
MLFAISTGSRAFAAPFAGMTQTGSMGLISAEPQRGSAPLADTAMMGVSNPFDKPLLAPVPQIARADNPDHKYHGGADERRDAEAEMVERVAAINRPDSVCPVKNDAGRMRTVSARSGELIRL